MNLTVIAILHNIFAKNMRGVSLNTHRLILTRSLRDSSQISFLSRQCYPDKKNFLSHVYRHIMAVNKYPYLVLNFSPSIGLNDYIRCTTNIFPHEFPILVFKPIDCMSSKNTNPYEKLVLVSEAMYNILIKEKPSIGQNNNENIQNSHSSSNNHINLSPNYGQYQSSAQSQESNKEFFKNTDGANPGQKFENEGGTFGGGGGGGGGGKDDKKIINETSQNIIKTDFSQNFTNNEENDEDRMETDEGGGVTQPNMQAEIKNNTNKNVEGVVKMDIDQKMDIDKKIEKKKNNKKKNSKKSNFPPINEIFNKNTNDKKNRKNDLNNVIKKEKINPLIITSNNNNNNKEKAICPRKNK